MSRSKGGSVLRVPAQNKGHPRLAFVQDALPFYGGAERMLTQAMRVFPEAPIYTLVHNPKKLAGTALEQAQVRTSFINRLPGARRFHRVFFPLYPLAIESLDLNAYDMIVSFSYAVAHGVLTRPDQTHMALLYTPLRQAYRAGRQPAKRPNLRAWAMERLLERFRVWDAAAAARPDYLLAISDWVAELACQTYRRPVQVLYPPVEVERFHPATLRAKYYICVARLEPHKRLDLVVQAFNRLRLPLLVVGDGSQRVALQKMSRENITFLGYQSDASVARLLGQARAFVHAAAEDFGIALVEAQAAGCPVIAYQEGGAGETVIHEQTGILFAHQEIESLIAAILAFEAEPQRFSPADLSASAGRFSAQRFRLEFARQVHAIWGGCHAAAETYEPLPTPAQPALSPLG